MPFLQRFISFSGFEFLPVPAQVVKREKDIPADAPYDKRQEDKQLAKMQKNQSLSVKAAFSDDMRKIAPPDLREMIDLRPTITKFELQEEVSECMVSFHLFFLFWSLC